MKHYAVRGVFATISSEANPNSVHKASPDRLREHRVGARLDDVAVNTFGADETAEA